MILSFLGWDEFRLIGIFDLVKVILEIIFEMIWEMSYGNYF